MLAVVSLKRLKFYRRWPVPISGCTTKTRRRLWKIYQSDHD